jgi:hypothetical protein
MAAPFAVASPVGRSEYPGSTGLSPLALIGAVMVESELAAAAGVVEVPAGAASGVVLAGVPSAAGAAGPPPFPGPEPGSDPGPEAGPDPAPGPGADEGPGAGAGPGPEPGPAPGPGTGPDEVGRPHDGGAGAQLLSRWRAKSHRTTASPTSQKGSTRQCHHGQMPNDQMKASASAPSTSAQERAERSQSCHGRPENVALVKGASLPSSGTSSQAMTYSTGPPNPPRKRREAMTKPTRSTVASTPRYWPRPPATPAIRRSLRLRRSLPRGSPPRGGGVERGGGAEYGGGTEYGGGGGGGGGCHAWSFIFRSWLGPTAQAIRGGPRKSLISTLPRPGAGEGVTG